MKLLIVMRGLPGSGKSTYARGLSGIVCSADDYFYNRHGVYQFNATKIALAHGDCRAKALAAFRLGATVIVDNTNTQAWEWQPYLQMAAEFGYSVRYHNCYDGGLSDSELAARNTHGVPVEAIARMRARWEEL